MSTSLPPKFPPLSTSLPSSFFSVPPCGHIQKNSTASHGMSTSLPNKIVPTPHINSSSSCHIIQKGSSSSLLPSSTQVVSPALSTPSISRSNIGGPVPTSPFVISSSTTTPACAKTQYAGDIREYDAFHRLIITPDEDGFAPSYIGSRMVAESITPFFDDAWGRWKEFPHNIREQIWNQFKTKLKGVEVCNSEVFEETHMKRNKDGTREEWIEPRAKETFAHPTSEVDSTSSSDITSIWTNVAGEMEAMRRQISELTERLQSSEANFAKVQKFMEKHMVESDESEGTDSDEE
ncbi:hypothetical protein H5410_037186 [Solanum commersonii]|uniref:Uncharacterized protein n=1 Tax=Solanum commersonii TaxID=4109 RepID=A0A9J5Y7A9_SOLCO|nr:hypothetical protein H5410_037186 [Solanum commersonii]